MALDARMPRPASGRFLSKVAVHQPAASQVRGVAAATGARFPAPNGHFARIGGESAPAAPCPPTSRAAAEARPGLAPPDPGATRANVARHGANVEAAAAGELPTPQGAPANVAPENPPFLARATGWPVLPAPRPRWPSGTPALRGRRLPY